MHIGETKRHCCFPSIFCSCPYVMWHQCCHQCTSHHTTWRIFNMHHFNFQPLNIRSLLFPNYSHAYIIANKQSGRLSLDVVVDVVYDDVYLIETTLPECWVTEFRNSRTCKNSSNPHPSLLPATKQQSWHPRRRVYLKKQGRQCETTCIDKEDKVASCLFCFVLCVRRLQPHAARACEACTFPCEKLRHSTWWSACVLEVCVPLVVFGYQSCSTL